LKASRALSIAILAFQIATIILLGLSIQTVIGSLMGSFSANSFKMTSEILGTGDMKLRLDADPVNQGLLGIDLSMKLAVRNFENVTIVRNSTMVYIEPGSHRPFSIDLLIPADEIRRMNQTGAQGFFELELGIRTLGGLVGFTNIIGIKGGIDT